MNKRKKSQPSTASKRSRQCPLKIGSYICVHEMNNGSKYDIFIVNSIDYKWKKCSLLKHYCGTSQKVKIFFPLLNFIEWKWNGPNDNVAIKYKGSWKRIQIIDKRYRVGQLVTYSPCKRFCFKCVVTEVDGDYVMIQPYGIAEFIRLHRNSIQLVYTDGWRMVPNYIPLKKQNMPKDLLYAVYTHREEGWMAHVIDMDLEFDIYLLAVYNSPSPNPYKWVDSEFLLTECLKEKEYDHFEDKNHYVGDTQINGQLFIHNNHYISNELLKLLLSYGDENWILNSMLYYRLNTMGWSEQIDANDNFIYTLLFLCAPISISHATHPFFNLHRLNSMHSTSPKEKIMELEKEKMNLSFKKGKQSHCNTMLHRFFNFMDPSNIDMFHETKQYYSIMACEPKFKLKINEIVDNEMKISIFYRGEMTRQNYYKMKQDVKLTTHLLNTLADYPRIEEFPMCNTDNPSDYTVMFDQYNKWYTSDAIESDILFDYQKKMVWQLIEREKNETALSEALMHDINGLKYNMLYGTGYHMNSGSSYPRASGGILVMDVGLGKTVCMISLMKLCRKKTLIVLPLTLMDQWKNEITKWAPGLSISEYHGKKRDTGGDVTLTTYGTVRRACISDLQLFERVIFDESHTITDSKTSTARAIGKINAKYRWCITATPITKNSFSSLIGQFSMLNIVPFVMPTYNSFSVDGTDKKSIAVLHHLLKNVFFVQTRKGLTKYNLSFQKTNIVNHQQTDKLDPNGTVLYHYLWNAMLKTCQKDTYQELNTMKNYLQMATVNPSLVPLYHYSEIISSQLGNGIMSFDQYKDNMGNTNYDNQVKETLTNLENADCVICMCPLDRPTITPCKHIFCNGCINEQLKFRKKCPCCRKAIDTSTLTELIVESKVEDDGEFIIFNDNLGRKCMVLKTVYNDWHQWKEKETAKLKYVKKIINETDESVIIFSQYNPVIKHLKKHFPSAEVITGRHTRKQRANAIENFQLKKSKVFILSTRCASIGITLTSGSHLIFMEPIVDPSISKQAIGRLARTGQTMDVHVHTMISSLTIDEGIAKMFCKDRFDKYDKITRKNHTGNRYKRAQKWFTTDILKALLK